MFKLNYKVQMVSNRGYALLVALMMSSCITMLLFADIMLGMQDATGYIKFRQRVVAWQAADSALTQVLYWHAKLPLQVDINQMYVQVNKVNDALIADVEKSGVHVSVSWQDGYLVN